MHYPPALSKLIALLKKFPGVGNKSAERFAFQMIEWPEELLREMSHSIANIKKELQFCAHCGAMIEKNPCSLCDLHERECTKICIVAHFKDILLIEQTREYRGLYHTLGGLISPIQGRQLPLHRWELLKKRIIELQITEVIVALDPTLEGDATALYIKEGLSECGPLTISRLALGLPMGSSLDYIDPGTLAFAFSGRNHY